jgi:diphthamide biosynthesis enzyme Dph1/Dph2-like protein
LGYDPLQQSTTCEDSLSIWDSVENPSSLLPLHKVFTLRYGLIEKAKLAKMIGVIFTTVGGAYHLKVFNRLKRLCE